MGTKPNENKLEKIFRDLIGPVPSLYVPPFVRVTNQKVGTKFIVAPRWSELTGDPPNPQEFWDVLQRLPMRGSLVAISMVSLLVSRRSFDDPIHATFCKDLLTAERLDDLKRFLKKNSHHPDAYNLFTRIGILWLLRLALAVASEGPEKKEPQQILGDLTLMANDYALGIRSDVNRLKDADRLSLLVEMLPTWEVTNPPDLAYGLSSAYRMFQILFDGGDPVVKTLRGKLPIDFASITFDGLLIEDYIGCVFGIYAWLNNLEVSKLLKGEVSLVIDTSGFLSQVNFPKLLFDSFVAARARTVAELKVQVVREPLAGPSDLTARLSSGAFLTDVLALRRFPLCRLDTTHIVCLDAVFLVELLIYGLYWRILDSLAAKKEDGDTFLELWGRLFELYLGEMLTFHYPLSFLSPLKLDLEYTGGQIDALLDLGGDVVIFEFKGSLLKNEAKLSRDTEAFKKEFALKFIENQKGDPKALRQLAAASAAVAEGALTTAAPPKRIFPVVVGYEPCLESFLVNACADDEFQKLLDPRLRQRVRPLTMMSVETFEIAVAYTSAGDISWPDLLERRFDPNDKVVYYSVYQAIYDWRTAGNRDLRRNEFVLQGFESAMVGALQKYKGVPA